MVSVAGLIYISIATAAEASAAPHILPQNRDVLNLCMCATEHPTVATGRTKQSVFVPTISFNAVIVNVVRIAQLHSTVYRVPTLATKDKIAGEKTRRRKQ